MQAVSAWIAFVGAFVGICIAVSLINDASGSQPGLLRLNSAAQIINRVANSKPSQNADAPKRVFLLGDSTILMFDSKLTLAECLKNEWNRKSRGGDQLSLSTLSGPGLGPRAFYFLSDAIADAQPDLILWEVSFAHLSESWRRFSIEDYCGWLDLARKPEQLGNALELAQITLDELLLYQGLVRTGMIENWRLLRNEQSRTDKLRVLLTSWIEERTGDCAERSFRNAATRATRLGNSLPGNQNRYNLQGERKHFGEALEGVSSDHPILQLMGVTIERFRNRGIQVLVYLNPINVDNLRAVGAVNPGALKAGAQAFKTVVESRGGHFIDLHDKFEDRYFSDAAGHFVQSKHVRSAEELAVTLSKTAKSILLPVSPPD